MTPPDGEPANPESGYPKTYPPTVTTFTVPLPPMTEATGQAILRELRTLNQSIADLKAKFSNPLGKLHFPRTTKGIEG